MMPLGLGKRFVAWPVEVQSMRIVSLVGTGIFVRAALRCARWQSFRAVDDSWTTLLIRVGTSE